MHTHSFWSDGDEFSELVAEWYKKRGYNFVVFTQHNSRMRGRRDRWLSVETKPGVAARLPYYERRFGKAWVQDRVYEGRRQAAMRRIPVPTGCGDIALARRSEQGNQEPLYGLAVDDAHKYYSPREIVVGGAALATS